MADDPTLPDGRSLAERWRRSQEDNAARLKDMGLRAQSPSEPPPDPSAVPASCPACHSTDVTTTGKGAWPMPTGAAAAAGRCGMWAAIAKAPAIPQIARSGAEQVTGTSQRVTHQPRQPQQQFDGERKGGPHKEDRERYREDQAGETDQIGQRGAPPRPSGF